MTVASSQGARPPLRWEGSDGVKKLRSDLDQAQEENRKIKDRLEKLEAMADCQEKNDQSL